MRSEPSRIDDVRSLSDACRWLEHDLAVIRDTCGVDSLKTMASNLDALSLSTCFSGIGCPEATLQHITRGLRHFVGDDSIRESPNYFAFDVRRANRTELMLMDNAADFIFGDIEDLLSPKLQVLRSEAARVSLSDLQDIFKRWGSNPFCLILLGLLIFDFL